MKNDQPTKRPEHWVVVEGVDRNEQDKVVSHLYTGPSAHNLVGPLCSRGWNRAGGHSFSIFRGNASARGTCKVCEKRRASGAYPVPPTDRNTKWI